MVKHRIGVATMDQRLDRIESALHSGGAGKSAKQTYQSLLGENLGQKAPAQKKANNPRLGMFQAIGRDRAPSSDLV